MRVEAFLFVGSLTLSPIALAQETQPADPPPEIAERCNAAKRPRMFCEVHQVSFQPVQVPIVYGLQIDVPQWFDTGSAEYRCRYAIARKRLFPHPAPKNYSGGCDVMEKKTTYLCACVLCTDAEREWMETYKHRVDVTPRSRGYLPREDTNVETDLYLRIQELRAFDEIEVSDCLQREWDRRYGHAN